MNLNLRNKSVIALLTCLLLGVVTQGMPIKLDREQMIAYTPAWSGERFADGRPKVSDELLERMNGVSVNQAWEVLNGAGFLYQFERGWKRVHPDGGPLVGRALTVTYMAKRPDLFVATNERAKADGHKGNQVSWPVNLLVSGDVYVADVYGREVGGPIAGASLANAIVVNSGNGVVFNGEIRDLTEIERIKGFNGFVRDFNPSAYTASMIMGINIPCMIGRVTVMPGDVVLGGREGVIFIPPHLAEEVVSKSEMARLRDAFAFERLKENKYTLAMIYGLGKWSDGVEEDFYQWLAKNIKSLPVKEQQIENILKKRGK
jgi:4-hydroxy-4-methyl-2-oxoglutarate aldolase